MVLIKPRLTLPSEERGNYLVLHAKRQSLVSTVKVEGRQVAAARGQKMEAIRHFCTERERDVFQALFTWKSGMAKLLSRDAGALTIAILTGGEARGAT